MPAPPRPLALCALAGLGLLGAAPARADRGRVTLALTPGYAVAYVDDRTAHGGGFDLEAVLGLTDALSLVVTGGLTFHDASETKRRSPGALSGYAALAGVRYAFDVLRLVPSFDLTVGAVGLRGDLAFGSGADAARVLEPLDALAIGLGFTLEYVITRHAALGLGLRYHAPVTALDRAPMILHVGPRAAIAF